MLDRHLRKRNSSASEMSMSFLNGEWGVAEEEEKGILDRKMANGLARSRTW